MASLMGDSGMQKSPPQGLDFCVKKMDKTQTRKQRSALITALGTEFRALKASLCKLEGFHKLAILKNQPMLRLRLFYGSIKVY